MSGKLWYVARGVERLVKWTGGKKVVWNCIECTRIKHPTAKPTPDQVRSEVWMSIIHGSMGLIYFVHEWEPRFNESALLGDREMLAAVTAINEQIAGLAPVLNSPTVEDAVTVASSNAKVPMATMVKRHKGATYLFAVAMRDGKTTATFKLENLTGKHAVDVLGEDRTLPSTGGVFGDTFDPYAVHLYRVK
ncbi:MAG: hypothetical protein R6V58_08950 [Planctomycetota bacterium]